MKHDWQLLQEYVQHKSNDAMCELIRRHIDMVHAAALRELRDSHRADDATQAVFLVLMRRARSLSPKVLLAGWLFTVTRYVAAESRRKELRRDHHEREAGIMGHKGQSEESIWKDIEPRLNQAIASLNRGDRDVVVMRYLQGHSTTIIAGTLGISETNARQRVFRALQRLRKKLLRKGTSVEEATLTQTLETRTMAIAPPILLTLIQSGVRDTATVSAASHSLAIGALKMMRQGKLIAIGATTCVAMALAGAGLAWAMSGSPPATGPQASTAPATAPGAPTATAKADLQATPKGVVRAAYAAALAGKEEEFLGYFDRLTDAQTATLRQVVHGFAAGNDLMEAVGDRFGAQAKQQMIQALGVGVMPADVENSTEKIDGQKATVDMGNAGPKIVSVVKVGDMWKVSSDTLANLNPEGVTQLDKALPALKILVQDIRAGKYKNQAEVMPAVMQAMRPQQ